MNKYTHFTFHFLLVICALSIGSTVLAIDNGNNSMVDKADSYDLQNFHKDDSEATWKSEKKDRPVATYEEKSSTATNTEAAPDVVKTLEENPQQVYESGQSLKVRETYKLSNDPGLKNIPTFFEAVESLEKKLNDYCPNGWVKVKEWRKPEASRYYVYFQASCL